jgi:hypothetical protein
MQRTRLAGFLTSACYFFIVALGWIIEVNICSNFIRNKLSCDVN